MGVFSVCFILLVSWMAYSYARSGYILTFPQELQLGAEENFCLSLFNITSDVSLSLNISCYGKHKAFAPALFKNVKTITHKVLWMTRCTVARGRRPRATVHLVIHSTEGVIVLTVAQKGQDGCFTWLLPDSLPAGLCDLSVQGSSNDTEYKFGETREITVVDNQQITFIQTDRPFYKPGQLVRARILTITQDLKPLNSSVTFDQWVQKHKKLVATGGNYVEKVNRTLDIDV